MTIHFYRCQGLVGKKNVATGLFFDETFVRYRPRHFFQMFTKILKSEDQSHNATFF